MRKGRERNEEGRGNREQSAGADSRPEVGGRKRKSRAKNFLREKGEAVAGEGGALEAV